LKVVNKRKRKQRAGRIGCWVAKQKIEREICRGLRKKNRSLQGEGMTGILNCKGAQRHPSTEGGKIGGTSVGKKKGNTPVKGA